MRREGTLRTSLTKCTCGATLLAYGGHVAEDLEIVMSFRKKLTGLVQVIEKKIELETFRAKEASQAVMEELWREGYEVEDLYHKGYKRGKEDGAWTARCPGCGDEAEVVEKRDRGVGRGTGRGAWVRDGRGFVRH